MKLIKHFFITGTIAAGLSSIYCAQADDSTTATPATTISHDNTTDATIAYPLYRPQEFDVDLYGSGSLGQQTLEHISGDRFRHHSLWGGGGGLTYFFCRYVGVGGEFDADARSHQFLDSSSGNIYARIPILNTGLAPYIFGGGGYQFQDIRQSFGQAGGGLEFRFCTHVGIFADGRYVIADHTENYALVRAGVRVSF